MRIISICPSNTEMLAYLGLTEQIVAVDDFSDWPSEVTRLPRLGPDLSIDMDLLESLKPDLVVASLSVPGMEKNIAELERRNLPHVTLNPQSLSDIAQDMLLLGDKTGTTKQAETIVAQYHAFVSQYQEISAQIEKKTLYWEWWPKPVFTPGKINWLTEVSELAGGENVFADVDQASVQTTWEDVHNRNPDHICLVWVGVKQEKMNPKLVINRPDWANMKAVKQKHIHLLEEQLYCRPSPRLLLGIKRLAALLHPESFPENDNVDPLTIN